MTDAPNPQLIAASPDLSAGVRANAGAGKTWTLVARVARLLLRGARPDAILCVTYTKAAAAEMQTRLFQQLGAWSVMSDAALAAELARLEEPIERLSNARALFARALETPGGLKIQTLHAFCEQLLRRFPLEAGVSPGFGVLETAAQARILDEAKAALAHQALSTEDGVVAQAYGRMAVSLDERGFGQMLDDFAYRRLPLAAYFAAVGAGGLWADVWRRCGFPDGEPAPGDIEASAAARIDWAGWRAAAQALTQGGASARSAAATMPAIRAAVEAAAPWLDEALALFCTKTGEARAWWDKEKVLQGGLGLAMAVARDEVLAACERRRAETIARDSLAALTLAYAQIGHYEAAKAGEGALDFDDLTDRALRLLTVGEGAAAWVLYKLDYGLDHLLLDEAQDTSPDQWALIAALSGEFFSGEGARGAKRTLFFVGDEKQSIYSFQGARPELFGAELRRYDRLVNAAGEAFTTPELAVSRRSRPEVLALVDAVCARPEVRAALRPGEPEAQDIIIRHATVRESGGCVDLWPLEAGDPAVEADYWEPVDAEPPQSASKRLALRIAGEVKRMIAAGEAQAGDVLILVRQRKALFEEIIRALKQERLPTAGADRLKLTEHIAVMDLLALGRVCLFAPDDLSLAALLRSPLFDIDERSLFELAQGREESLWATLSGRGGERAEWVAAREWLSWAMGQAFARSPFDFYGRVLNRLDAAGRSMRQRMIRRLGLEAGEVLDEFLSQALALEGQGASSLEALVAALSASEFEVKREQEQAGGKVRVMTVHAAKGLEAPVVFLPDTTGAPRDSGALLHDGEGWLWASRKADDSDISRAAREMRAQAQREEVWRLLYVAMTRARNRLVICGAKRGNSKAGRETGCWYEAIEAAFEGLPQVRAAEGCARFGADPGPRETQAATRPAPAVAPLPAWALTLAAPETRSPLIASPSSLASAGEASPSPLAEQAGVSRFRRGELIHRLLQVLPDLPPSERAVGAARLLAREVGLSGEQRLEMAAAALGVLEDPRFGEVFAPGSRAEAALAGGSPRLPGPISGRVDRLSILADKVLVVDFKTNRPAPARIEAADPAYILQMAAYSAVLAQIFPGRRIEAAIVWTDGPALMPVPENLIDEALARIAQGS